MSGATGTALAQRLGYPVPARATGLVRGVRALAATAPVARVLARTLRPLDAVLARRNRSLSASGLLAGLPVVMLTTTGARSGLARTVPLIPVVTDDVLAVLGTNFGGERTPAWVLNLEVSPDATLSFADRRVQVTARALEGPERDRLLAAATATYPGFGRYVTRAAHRHVRVFALEQAP